MANRRLSRIFARDGKTLVLAYDHGAGGANFAGMADQAKTIRECVAAGADAILTTVGVARNHGPLIERVGLVLSLDGLIDDPEYAVLDAIRLGADAGKVICTPWSKDNPRSIAENRRLATVCREWGLPLMVETIPVSFQATEEHTPEKVGRAAKIGEELGADVLKIHFTGDVASFRQAIKPLVVPVVVLGGPMRPDPRSTLADVADAMASGGAGVAIGRNIWGYERPERMVAALAAIVHGGASVEQAARELG
jgi:class I fructose-bisphosphate aldolase/fructose-bisphosphate aldolase/2-amino-3,7-dideoxy-D-threo-hept-6-ulosonate synthase